MSAAARRNSGDGFLGAHSGKGILVTAFDAFGVVVRAALRPHPAGGDTAISRTAISHLPWRMLPLQFGI